MKESKMKKQVKNTSNYSDYWFDNDYYNNYYGGNSNNVVVKQGQLDADDEQKQTAADVQESISEKAVVMIKLSAFKRSCSNFVKILTGRDIPVEFNSTDASFTDGKTVVISSKVENNFDSTVGLALHEASHILLTSFDLLQRLYSEPKFRRTFISKQMIKQVQKINPKIGKWIYTSELPYANSQKKFFGNEVLPSNSKNANKAKAQRASEVFLTAQFKSIVNWIEDRRIDNYVYSTAPGYRGYYECLYERYFLNNEIDQSLKNDKLYNKETFDSYMFRLINLLNKNNDDTVLKGLKEIKSLIDVGNIKRLTNTEEVFNLSAKVLEIIVKNSKKINFVNSQMKKNKVDGLSEGDIADHSEVTEFDLDKMTDQECKTIFGITKKDLEKLFKKMKVQKDFLSGDIKKIRLSKASKQFLNMIGNSGATLEKSGGPEFNNQKVDVVLLSKINDEVITNSRFNGSLFYFPQNFGLSSLLNSVNSGFVLGKVLGRKLQLRNEERTLKHTRQSSGKIDRRIIAGLGYDDASVFSKLDISNYKKVHIHISIDASGSMAGGAKFNKAIKCATAIAVAAQMVSNIEVVVSFRTTLANSPVVYIGYDSRVNNLTHIRRYWHKFMANGTTPESLCFEAMMNKIIPIAKRNEKLFFVNFSDGEPCFTVPGYVPYSRGRRIAYDGFYYQGEKATKHTRRMITKLEQEHNATIISYFISELGGTDNLAQFRAMYGHNNSFNINVENIEQVAKTMNKKFMENDSDKD